MYSMPSPSSGPIKLCSIGSPSEPGAILNTYKELKPKYLLLKNTLNLELPG
jgi:hypothetical protein